MRITLSNTFWGYFDQLEKLLSLKMMI